MRRQLVRHKSLPALNTAALSSDSADKTLQNGSAVPDPVHIKPFEHGFKREIVLRAVQEPGGKQHSDVYYHTPDGQKLRSRREIADYLGRNRKLPLLPDNFTFARSAIYHPPQEVVRQATRRWNKEAAPASLSGAPVAPAASASDSASARIRSTSEEAAAATASPCANREGVLSVRRSTRKQCLCCRESLGGRKRLRGTESSNAAGTSQAKRPRKSMAATTLPTKAPQTTRAKNLGGKPPGASPPPKAQRNSRPTTSRGPGRPPKRRAQSLGRVPLPSEDGPRSASGGRRPGATREAERRVLPRRSLPGSPVPFDDSEESSEDGNGEGPLETSPKRAFVLLQDVLRAETGPKSSSELDGDAAAPSSSSVNSSSVVPIALKAHVQPWKSSMSWELYELIKARNSAGTGVVENEEGETSVAEPRSGMVTAHSSRQGKTGFEDEEECATDWLKGPTIVEDSAEALEVVLEDADAGRSAAASEQGPTRSPATPRRSQQRTPALAAKGSPTSSGAPAPVCGINCPRALGQTPQLRCTRCLCLFHPVCVGLLDIHPHVTRGSFICKPCNKVSYRVGKGSARSSTQPALVDNALPNETPRARPLQAEGPSTALVASTVASTAVPSTPRPSFVTSLSAVPPGPSSVSLPMAHLMAAGPLPPLQFVCSPTESPSAGPPRLLPPMLSVGAVAAVASPPVRVNAQPPRCMPTLVAAPRPPNPAAVMTVVPYRPAAMPALQPQPTKPQLYTINLKHKLSDSAMAALVNLVQQAAQKSIAELQRVCNKYGMVLHVGRPAGPATPTSQLPHLMGPTSPLPQGAAALQPPVSSSQAVVATRLVSASALQPVSGNVEKKLFTPSGQPSVLKSASDLSESSTATSGESAPTSAALSQPVSAQKPESGSAPPQPAVAPSVCGEVAVVVPKAELKTDKTAPLGSRHRAILPKQPCGMQAVAGNKPSNTASVTSSEANGVVRAAATLAPQGTTATAGIPTRPGEHTEAAAAAAEEKEASIATFCKIENVVSMAAAETEWPVASDGSEGEGRLVIAEGNERAEGTANHAGENPSPCKKETETKAEKPSDRSRLKGEGAWQPSLPHTPPPSESSHSAEAAESSASEQGLNDSVATPPNGVDAQGSRKVARIKRVKRRKPQGGASPLNSSPIWVRTQRQLVFVTDRTSTVDPLALHRDVVPNSARVFSDLASAMVALDNVFSWLPLPSLCCAAQVCKAWNIAANSPFLWKRIDFRQFRVQNWDTCVMKLRSRCPEELILDGESLDHLLPYAEQFSMVERVSLVVNARQLASVARAFPALRSLRAVVVRKGSAAAATASQNSAAAAVAATASQNGGEGGEAGGHSTGAVSAPAAPPPQRQASLGCLTELLCIKGLERLELSGAHGLALLPLTMTATSLAQRCQQLRMLSLTTVQVLTPVVVFPISLLEQLEELHLGNCTNWSNASFVNLCQLRELRRLTLELGEDGPGFHTMLLKLTRLERLELKRWTLRDSLGDVLPRMKRLRSFVLWPLTSSAALKSHRNALRSCLSAGDGLERFTWVLGCKPLMRGGGSSGVNRAMSVSLMQHVAPDLRISFEGGALCRCQGGTDSVPASSASSPSKTAEAAACASPNTKSHKSASDVVDTGNASANDPTTSSTSTNSTSPRKSGATPDGAPQSQSSNPEAPCCPLAKKISEVWNTSSEEPWHLTLRQFRDGLQHCMGPRTAVCVCVHVES